MEYDCQYVHMEHPKIHTLNFFSNILVNRRCYSLNKKIQFMFMHHSYIQLNSLMFTFLLSYWAESILS